MAANESRFLPRSPTLLLATLALMLTQPAAAVGLGDLRVQSYLGEPLAATVTIIASAGEEVSADCFALAPSTGDGLPTVSQARFAVDLAAKPPRVRISTFAPQNEPALQLRIKASCPGGGGFSRDYTILLDPPPVVAPPVVVAPVASVAVPSASPAPASPSSAEAASPSAPGLRAIPGDSLRSLATAIYPKNLAAREGYVDALREQNANVASLGPDDQIPEGTVLTLPDLREFARTLPARTRGQLPRTQVAATPPAEKRPPPRVEPAPPPAKAAPAPRKPEAPAPRKAEAPTPKSEPPRKAEPAPRKPAPAERKVETPPPKAPPPEAASKPAPEKAPEPPKLDAPQPKAPAKAAERAGASGAAVLRLSTSELDMSRSRDLDEKMRAQMRERLLLIESDDQIAALLTLRNNLKQLETQVAELQQKLTGLGVPGGTGSAPGSVPGSPGVQGTPAAAGGTPSPGAGALPASAKPAPGAEPGFLESVPVWLWGVLSVLAAAIAAFVGSVVVLRRSRAAPGAWAAAPQASATRTSPATPAPAQRFLMERFPDLDNGQVSIDDPDSIVEAAKSYYTNGSAQRAIDLLEFSVNEKPTEVKPWLALLELFHLEAYTHEFSQLAARFREKHGDNESWPKIKEIGRELDPGNPLFAE